MKVCILVLAALIPYVDFAIISNLIILYENARVVKLCENPASVSVTQSYLFSYLILVIILMTKAIYLIACLMF